VVGKVRRCNHLSIKQGIVAAATLALFPTSGAVRPDSKTLRWPWYFKLSNPCGCNILGN
jgi:hypothetical protein